MRFEATDRNEVVVVLSMQEVAHALEQSGILYATGDHKKLLDAYVQTAMRSEEVEAEQDEYEEHMDTPDGPVAYPGDDH